MIKLIASDLDGTLVNSNHYISQENVNAIRKAQDKGAEFIVATGRAFEDAKNQVMDSGIKCKYLVMNGSEIRNESGDILYSDYLSEETVMKVVESLLVEGLYVELYTTDGIYTVNDEDSSKMAFAYKANFFFPNISIEEAYKDAEGHPEYEKVRRIDTLEDLWIRNLQVGKIISFSSDVEKLNRLREHLPREFAVAASGSFLINIEITTQSSEKGNAVRSYARMKGISLSEVMTIGDGLNDISMMDEAFGFTVAMGNGLPEVKEKAKYLTSSNDQDGVAAIIDKLI